MKKKLSILTLAMFWPALCQATDWYASPTGSSGDGSLLNPWALNEVVWEGEGLADGDTLYLLSGTYTTPMNTLGMIQTSNNFPGSITISAYDMIDKPILNANGLDRHCLYADNVGTFTVDGVLCYGDIVRVYNGLAIGDSTPVTVVKHSGFNTWGNVGVNIYGDGAEISNTWVRTTANNAIQYTDVSNSLTEYVDISDWHTNTGFAWHNGTGSDNVTRHVTATAADYATYPTAEGCYDVNDAVGINYSNQTLEDFVFIGCADQGIKAESANGFVARRGIIADTHGYGMKFGDAAPEYPTTTAVTLENIVVYNWGSAGETSVSALNSYVDIINAINLTLLAGPLTATNAIWLSDGVSGSFRNIIAQVNSSNRYVQTAAGVTISNYTFDYNDFYGGASNGWLINGTGYSFSTWKSTFSQDANSYNVNPYVTSTGKLTSATPDSIKYGGTLVDGKLIYRDGERAPIGAYLYDEGLLGPPGMPILSIGGGAFQLGKGGMVYVAPVSYILTVSGSYLTTVSGDKITLE